VVPSEWFENFPIAVLESLALGTPVVASNIGGLPDMIVDQVTGRLFTPANKEELAVCIQELVSDPDKLTAMSQAAKKDAIDRFGPDVHYSQLMDIYSSASVT
jgi:glycosyltransferase involved in cell wall biosynthesis